MSRSQNGASPKLTDLKKELEKAMKKKSWVKEKKPKGNAKGKPPKPKIEKIPRAPSAGRGKGPARKSQARSGTGGSGAKDDEDDDDDDEGLQEINEEAEEAEQLRVEGKRNRVRAAVRLGEAFDDTTSDMLFDLLDQEDADAAILTAEGVQKRYDKHAEMIREQNAKNTSFTILAGYINSLCPSLGIDYRMSTK